MQPEERIAGKPLYVHITYRFPSSMEANCAINLTAFVFGPLKALNTPTHESVLKQMKSNRIKF